MVPGARIEHVTAMGEERDHARFSLAGGGARARGVAFRTSQRDAGGRRGEPHDVAVVARAQPLERRGGGARGAAQPLPDARRAVDDSRDVDLAGPSELLPIRRSMAGELQPPIPRRWCADGVTPTAPLAAAAAVCDRRGEGLAGVAGDLLTSGERVLLVVADVARRRAALEALVAGMAAWTRCAVDLVGRARRRAGGRSPALDHLLALDPPPVPEGLDVLPPRSAARWRLVHDLAWGEPERDFALAHWRAQLDLRPPLVELWRALAAPATLDGDAPRARAARRGPAPARRRVSAAGSSACSASSDLARWDAGAGAERSSRADAAARPTSSARRATAPTPLGWPRRSAISRRPSAVSTRACRLMPSAGRRGRPV